MTLPHENKEAGQEGESKETTISTDAPVKVEPEDTAVAESSGTEPADEAGDKGGDE